MFDQIPPELRNAGPGVAGSFIAMLFMRRPMFVAVGLFIAGCIVSYYATPPVAAYFDLEKGEGLIGLLLGTFSMALVGKVFDTIEAIEPPKLWLALLQFIRKRFGLEP
jgi:hypothetical protein